MSGRYILISDDVFYSRVDRYPWHRFLANIYQLKVYNEALEKGVKCVKLTIKTSDRDQ